MQNTLIAIFLFLFSSMGFAEGRVRRIIAAPDQIVAIRTAVGIATIIQLPDRPNSVVVGDQDSFKVEYLDKAITVKPLHDKAASNLYLYTDWKRYNVQLTTASRSSADYVVYIESKRDVQKTGGGEILWRAFKGKITNPPFVFESKRLAVTPTGNVLLEFLISAETRQEFKPEWIWITQTGRVRPINQLFLSQATVESGHPIQGIIQLQKRDLEVSEPLRIEIRRQKNGYLTIPKAVLWN